MHDFFNIFFTKSFPPLMKSFPGRPRCEYDAAMPKAQSFVKSQGNLFFNVFIVFVD